MTHPSDPGSPPLTCADRSTSPSEVGSIGHSSAERLAFLLIRLSALLGCPDHRPGEAHRLLDEAIELAFLHTRAYRAAKELFRLEGLGQLDAKSSAFDLIAAARHDSTPVQPPDRAEVTATDERPSYTRADQLRRLLTAFMSEETTEADRERAIAALYDH